MFKVKDWCFCEFELVQIQKIEDGQIHGVTDGYIDHGGNLTNECFPLNFEVILISEKFRDYWNAIIKTCHPKTGNAHSRLVEWWTECCENKDDEREILRICKMAEELVKKMQSAVEIEV